MVQVLHTYHANIIDHTSTMKPLKTSQQWQWIELEVFGGSNFDCSMGNSCSVSEEMLTFCTVTALFVYIISKKEYECKRTWQTPN